MQSPQVLQKQLAHYFENCIDVPDYIFVEHLKGKNSMRNRPVNILLLAIFIPTALALVAYFAPYVVFDTSFDHSLLSNVTPNRFSLPVIVRMAEHGISGPGGSYTKTSEIESWTSLIVDVKDPKALPYLKKLSLHGDPFISRNAVLAIQNIEASKKSR